MIRVKLLDSLNVGDADAIYHMHVFAPVPCMIALAEITCLKNVTLQSDAKPYIPDMGTENPEGMHNLMKCAHDDALEYERDLTSQGVPPSQAVFVRPLGSILSCTVVLTSAQVEECCRFDLFPEMKLLAQAFREAVK